MARRVRGQLIDGLLEHLPEASIGIDRSGRIRFANRSACRLLEVDGETVVEQELWEVLPVTDFSRFLGQLAKSGSHQPVEQIFAFPGQVCAVQVVPVDSEDGRLQGWVVYLRDMSAVQHLEKGLEQFLVDVNRELKLPLTAIKGYVETLLEGAYQSPEVTKKFLQIINEETNRLARIIVSMEEASSPSKPSEPVRRVSVGEMLREIVALFGPRAAQRNIQIRLELPNFVPELPVRPDSLRKAIVNLVDNAVKSCGLNQQGHIDLRLELRREATLIHVCDDGVGIDPIHHQKIFEKFYRVTDGPLAELGGTGLGLAVAKEAVEAHAGHLTVQSAPGRGCQFLVQLPVS